MKKLSSLKHLKKTTWQAFSKYIRQKYADHAGYVTCCDTGERKHWTETHCGHLFHNTERNQYLGGNELWYYENNFAPQSSSGNIFNKNDSAKHYMLWAVKKYGVEEVEHMRKMKQKEKRWTREEIQSVKDRCLTQ